jgi:hypothetical protein
LSPATCTTTSAARNRAEQPWQQRREGKQRLVRQIEAERERHIQDHLGELAAFREHDAHAARDAVIEALERIEVAERAWADVERYYAGLLAAVDGLDARDIPTLNLSAVKSEAERVRERGVPAPLPRSLYLADEDRTIRSAA